MSVISQSENTHNHVLITSKFYGDVAEDEQNEEEVDDEDDAQEAWMVNTFRFSSWDMDMMF